MKECCKVGVLLVVLFLQNSRAPPVGDALRYLFNSFDNNGDGYLSTEELRNLFLVLGKRIADHEIIQDFGTKQVAFSQLLGTLSTPEYETTLLILVTFSLRRLFDLHDRNQDGLLEKSEIKAIMTKLGFVRSDADIENLFGTGPVTFDHFRDILESPEYVNAKISSSGPRDVAPLRDLFTRFDKDNSNTLDLQELKGVMRELGFVLTDQQIEDIFGNKPVDFEHFVEKVHAPPTVADILGTTMTKYIQQQFQKFDTNRNGVLEFDELRAALNNLDIKISDREIIKDFGLPSEVVNIEKFEMVMALKFKDLIEIPWDVKATMMFEQLDKNGDGVLSPDELEEFASAVGYYFTDSEMEAEYRGASIDVESFKKFLLASSGVLVVESEDSLTEKLVRTCNVMAQGKEKFTKLDVIHYFNNVIYWKIQDKELNDIFANKDYWTFDECLKYMRANVKYKVVPVTPK